MKTRNFFLLCVVLWGSLFLFCFCGEKKISYTLGVISNFEGKNNQSAIDALKSIKLAYEEFKADHPAGFDLQILPVDDGWDPEKIKGAYACLVNKSDIILFMTSSTAFLSIYDEVSTYPDKLHLLAGGINSMLSGKDDNVIRNAIDDRLEQQHIAAFLKARNAGPLLIIQDDEKNIKYNRTAFTCFSEYYEDPVVHVTFSPTDMDLTDPLGRFRQGEYSCVYIIAGGSPREEGIIIQHLRKIDPGITIMTTPWSKGSVFLESMGKNRENVIIPTYVTTSNTRYLDYATKFREKYKASPGEAVGAVLCYDLAEILFNAVYKTGSVHADPLKKEILSNTYNATTGTIRFDRYGDLIGNLHFYRYVGDKREYLD